MCAMYLIRVSFITTFSQADYILSLQRSSWGSTNDLHFNMSGSSNMREVQAYKRESLAWVLSIECAGNSTFNVDFDAT